MRYEGIREVNALPARGNNYDLYLLKNDDGTTTPYAYKDGEFVEVSLGGGQPGPTPAGVFVIHGEESWDEESMIISNVDKTPEEIISALENGKIAYFVGNIDTGVDVVTTTYNCVSFSYLANPEDGPDVYTIVFTSLYSDPESGESVEVDAVGLVALVEDGSVVAHEWGASFANLVVESGGDSDM